MGGGSSTNKTEEKDESFKDENENNEEREEKGENEEIEENEENEEIEESESLERIKEEGEDEEEEDDDVFSKRNDFRERSKKREMSRKRSKKATNSIIKKKKKKNNDYFSIEEDSSKQSDIISSSQYKDNIKISDQSSFIDVRKYNTNSTVSQNSKKSINSEKKQKKKKTVNTNDKNNKTSDIIQSNSDNNNQINNTNSYSNSNNKNNQINNTNSNSYPTSNNINQINITNSDSNLNYMNNNNNLDNAPRTVKVNNNHIQKADNQVFGEFNYTNMDNNIEETEPKMTETVETEPYKELTLQEKIYNEYQRHKEYLDANEKGVYSEIHKKSYKNAKRYKYRKSLLLHEKEITCICSLSGKIKKITYATSSLDKTIKLWNTKFASVHKIKNLQWHSNFLCEFDTTNLLSSESIYVKMYDLMSDSFECTKTYRDHIDDINAILPLINYEKDEYSFMSGGKDKILRLWNNDFDSPIRYYEGHFDTVTHIQKIAGDTTKIISCSIDKTFIIWDIRNTNPIKVFNNYFNHLCLLGDNVGFCCGAYDNKIRFYDDAYLISKCLVSEFYGIRHILMIDDYYMLIVDIDNNINVLDTYENNFLFKYAGSGGEVASVIKSYNWDKDNSENKIIITACKDGYVYLYSFELEINNKISKNKISKKKDDKKDRDKSKKKTKKSKSAKKEK